STYFDDHWGRDNSQALRADFASFLAQEVSIDYMTDLGAVTIEAFAAGGGSLGTVSAGPGSGTLTYKAAANEIASVEFSIEGHGGADFGVLDHMVIRILDPGTIVIEPDAWSENADISNPVAGVTLSAQGDDSRDNLVYAVMAYDPPTGERSFGWTDLGGVTIEAFAAGGGSLGTVSAGPGSGTLTYAAATNEVASVEFSIEGHGGADFGVLDHMVIRVPEPGRVGLALAAFAALGMLRRSRRHQP
ncbi:MAG: hypothetical protein JRH19_28420, partial [Deltaproteobacteria bacterium]|nr:hypothetical protein [Deltaproteobacteria bacterium]